MKFNLIVLVLFLFSLIFFSCDKEEKNEEYKENNFIYPLSVGNAWEYIREWNIYFFSDSSGAPQYFDTLTYSSDVSVTITDKVLLHDTLETYEMVGVENDGINTYTQTNYYKNQDDGLYIYAYIAGGPIILPKKQHENKIRFKGLEFKSFHQLLNYVQQLVPAYTILSDSIYFEEPPVKTLQYPIEIGDQWTYRESGSPWRMDRLVSSRKIIELEIGTFNCYEIKFIYDMDEDGEWDDDIWIVDYINEKGLINRIITILCIEEITVEFPEGTGNFFDVIDEYKLTEVSVQ